MITEWFLGWIAPVVEWLLSLLPDWTLPAELTAPGGLVQMILGNAAGLGVWIDWVPVIAIGLIPLGVWIVGVSWKALRTAFSHFPGIGGSG